MGTTENTHGRVPSCRVPVKHTETWVERPAQKAVVQRPNVTNAYGVRPKVLHIRQPELLARNVGGQHRTKPAPETEANRRPQGQGRQQGT